MGRCTFGSESDVLGTGQQTALKLVQLEATVCIPTQSAGTRNLQTCSSDVPSRRDSVPVSDRQNAEICNNDLEQRAIRLLRGRLTPQSLPFRRYIFLA